MDTSPLPAVVGSNFRKIRTEHGVTQAEVAAHARRLGLRWNQAKVGDFERGRSQSPFKDVLLASLALDNAIGAGPGPFRVLGADGTVTQRKRPRVHLSELVAFEGHIELADGLVITGDALAKVCNGGTWELTGGIDTADDVGELLDPAPGIAGQFGLTVGNLRDITRRADASDTRLARRLGIERDHLLALCWTRFSGRTFTEERDRLSANNPARRGQVSRELREQLEQELHRGDH